ncbi:hypothetical protein [Neptunomonas japonica]|uniref:hypothetical protein n=1 Tax=Neptunomonas japonica TaxID=417574 RepID=UPI00041F8104|nr:hypothetical protein [Neptunomonas japonica]
MKKNIFIAIPFIMFTVSASLSYAASPSRGIGSPVVPVDKSTGSLKKGKPAVILKKLPVSTTVHYDKFGQVKSTTTEYKWKPQIPEKGKPAIILKKLPVSETVKNGKVIKRTYEHR